MGWNQLANEMFLAALELPTQEQQRAFVAGSNVSPTEKQAVSELLDAHWELIQSEFLESPPFAKPNGGSSGDSIGTERTHAQHESLLATGTTFGRYWIERAIGKGGMGAVYLALDTKLQRLVALKIPTRQDDAELYGRIQREARAMASTVHRNICTLYDVDEFAGTQFLSMQFVEGETLAHLLQTERPFPPEYAAELLRKIASATHQAHLAGVVHRDLKPANIMIDSMREPIIMDFGLAGIASESALNSKSKSFYGTPAYMAPEQALSDHLAAGVNCDVYSLGAILYELLTGRTVYQGSTASILKQLSLGEKIPAVSELQPSIDRTLESICMKAIERDANRRFATSQDFANALESYLSAKLAQTRVIPLEAQRPVRSSQDWRWIAVWLLFAGFLFGGLFFAMSFIRIATPNGTLLVIVNDDSIATELQGHELTIRETMSGRSYHLAIRDRKATQSLPYGVYAIEVTDPNGSLKLSTNHFEIKRGDSSPVVVVEFESNWWTSLWKEPRPLSPAINTSATEENVSISRDELTLLFNRSELGKNCIWESHRSSVNDDFPVAVLLPPTINQPDSVNDCPSLSADQLTLWFSSNRPDGVGSHDLWYSQRQALDAPWQEPVNAGEGVNSVGYEQSPYLSKDELTLLFSRATQNGMFQIYEAKRATPNQQFGEAHLLKNVNNGVCSSFPALTPDGLNMLFVHCPSSADPLKLYVATRSDEHADFGAPRQLSDSINSLPASGPSLSGDGRNLYLSRQQGRFSDVWLSEHQAE